jgi:hypothetical protein
LLASRCHVSVVCNGYVRNKECIEGDF